MILVDDRERRSGVCEALAALGVPHQIAHLAIGDYVIHDSIYIERKTVPDFLESRQDLRLFDQVARLRADQRRALLIVEGMHLPGNPSVRGVLCSLAAQWCLPVLRSNNAAGTAWLLAHMHQDSAQCMAPYHRYDYRTKQHISSMGERMLEHRAGYRAALAGPLRFFACCAERRQEGAHDRERRGGVYCRADSASAAGRRKMNALTSRIKMNARRIHFVQNGLPQTIFLTRI
ncbi:MAG: hypothetical protein NTV22_14515 [bacterium]|nr:hypothetical protein [bacterium]